MENRRGVNVEWIGRKKYVGVGDDVTQIVREKLSNWKPYKYPK